MTISEPKFIKIQYRTFYRLTRDGLPCGCLSYFASAEMAAENGEYVEMYISSTPNMSTEFDFMGQPIRKIEWEHATSYQQDKYITRLQKEWNSNTKHL